MPTLAEFWADSHHGNAFGLLGPMYGPSGHRGDDTNGWPSGTPVLAIRAGTVVRSEMQSGLGNVVTIWDGSLYTGYCHLAARAVAVGDHVTVGQSVGGIGTTGTLSTGVHVHVTASYTGNNPATAAVIDPRPFIVAARTAASGGGVTPLQDQGDDDMRIYEDKDTLTASGDKASTLYVGAPGRFAMLTRFANDRAVLEQAFGPIITMFPNDLKQVAATCLAAAQPTAGPSDVARFDSLDKAVAAVPGLVIAEQKKPGN